MSSTRRTALVAGILYLVTIAASIPALALKTPLLTDAAAEGAAGQALLAVVLELVLAAACVGTAVVLHPIIRRASEHLSLGFLAARILETALILVGVLAILTIITARRTDDSAVPALVALHDEAFLLGPGLIPAINALCLGTLLYRARLVPRVLPLIGLAGAPLLLASALATLLGLLDQVSPLAGLLALPIAVWEFALGILLTVKGFHQDSLDRLPA